MNERGHETPGAYYRRKHPGTKKFANASSLSSWTVTNVRSILKQEMYYGATVGHKREKVAVNSKVTRSVPKSGSGEGSVSGGTKDIPNRI